MTYSPISTWQQPVRLSRGVKVRDAYWRLRGWLRQEASTTTASVSIAVMLAVALAM